MKTLLATFILLYGLAVNANVRNVFLTVVLNKNLPENLMSHFGESNMANDLQAFLSFKLKDTQFKTIITTSREEAISQMSRLLEPNEVISGLHVVVHGGIEKWAKDTISTTTQEKIGYIQAEFDPTQNVYKGNLSQGFQDFFSPIKSKIKSNANVVFTSCNNLDQEDTEFNNAKAKILANFFGLKDGSIYFSSTYDNSIFLLNYKDYTISRFSKEYIVHSLKGIITLGIFFGIGYGAVDSLDSVVKIALSSIAVWGLGIEPIKFYLRQLESFVLKMKISGWLYVFKDGNLNKYEIKDKRTSYSQVFRTDSYSGYTKVKCSAIFH